jgi:hypothetical protein
MPRALVVPLFVCAFALSLIAQTPATFERQQYAMPEMGEIQARADINKDGVADLLVSSFQGTYSSTDGLYVMLADGNGAFTRGQQLTSHQLVNGVAIDDFNRDGRADVVFAIPSGLRFSAGHGDGTFSVSVAINSQGRGALASADFNRDGKADLAFGHTNTLKIALGHGDGTFGAPRLVYTGPTSYSYFPNVNIGDFDGDGRADIAAAEEDGYDKSVGYFTKTVVLYGNGSAGFAQHSITVGGSDRYIVADVNQDGKADLVGIYVISYGDRYGDGVHILYGSASRTMSARTLGSRDFAAEYSEKMPVGVADFNGDGRLDIAEPITDYRDNYNKIAFYYQRADGSFELSTDLVAIAPISTDDLRGAVAGNYDDDNKPDLVTVQITGTLNSVVNTSTGSFPTCSAPGRGLHVCSPVAGAISSSPVRFNVAATDFAPIRKVEVWVDGTKRVERFFSYATNSFLNTSLSLGAGSHTATIFSVGFDNRLQRKSFTFTVAGGSGCTPASSTATVICSPVSGSTVGNPVTGSAKGGSSVKNMEIWVDGTRRATSSTNSISVSLTLSAGKHKLTAFGKNGSTVLSSAVSYFTVD